MKKVNGILFLLIALSFVVAQTSPSLVATVDEDRAINWNNGSSIARASDGSLMVVYGMAADTMVYATTYDADFDTWNTAMVVGKGSVYNGQIQSSAKVVADASNNFHVIWSDNFQMYHSTYDGSAWTTPVSITGTAAPWDTLQCAFGAVDIDGNGNIWAAWSTLYESDNISEWFFASMSSDGGANWSTPDTLFTDIVSGDLPSTYSMPHLACGPNGEVGVAMRGPKMGPKARYAGVFQQYDGSEWGATEVICDFYASTNGDSVDVYQVSLAYDGAGNCHAAFYTDEGDFADEADGQIYYVRRSASGTWNTPVKTTNFSDGSCDYPAIAVGSNNSIYIILFGDDAAGIRRMYGVSSDDFGVTWCDTIRLSENTVDLDARGPSIGHYVGTAGADVLWLQNTSDSAVDEIYYGLIPFVDFVGVADETQPVSYQILRNYPNPFNPSTNIQFSVVNPGNVQLTVYNMLGQEITQLVNRNMEIGTYEITFNASSLASGVYFYRLQTTNQTITQKLLYLK